MKSLKELARKKYAIVTVIDENKDNYVCSVLGDSVAVMDLIAKHSKKFGIDQNRDTPFMRFSDDWNTITEVHKKVKERYGVTNHDYVAGYTKEVLAYLKKWVR